MNSFIINTLKFLSIANHCRSDRGCRDCICSYIRHCCWLDCLSSNIHPHVYSNEHVPCVMLYQR